MTDMTVPQSPIRIAVLNCDKPFQCAAAKYGTYAGVFKQLFAAAAESLKEEIPGIEQPGRLEITSWEVYKRDQYPNLDDIDAIVMTGSRASAGDNKKWILKLTSFVRKVLAQDRVRIIGACFGHQILGRALGLPIHRNPLGWELSVIPMTLTPTGASLFHNVNCPNHETLSILQMHRDIVDFDPKDLPDDIENLASTEICKLQGMYCKKRFFTTQGHPEYTAEITSEMVEKRAKAGILTKKLSEDAISRVQNPHDGLAIGAALLRFLME